MRFLLAAAALALVLVAAVAEGAMKGGPPVMSLNRIRSVVLPLDGFADPAAAYSFRKLKSSYAGPAIRIRRASDNAETDINFLGFVPGLGSPLDVAAANAHCVSTTCNIRTWYDQSGNARDLIQTTATIQPDLRFDCISVSQACMRMLDGDYLGSVNFTSTGVTSHNTVFRRAVMGAGTCLLAANGNVSGNRMQATIGSAGVDLVASGGTVAVASAENAWHSATGIVNAAASELNIDGVRATGTITPSAAPAPFYVSGTGACDEVEMIIWGGTLSAPEIAALTANQRSFWGF